MDILNSIINKQLENHKQQALLIGSANYPFSKVMEVRRFPFDLNAAEYTIQNRISPGCDILNDIELSGQKYANEFLHLGIEYDSLLSAYSGTQANQIIYNAILRPRDKILVFSESSGGHASHTKFLEKYYQIIQYNFSFYSGIDYGEIENLITQNHPRLVIAGSTLYPNSINYTILGALCKKYDACLLADISHTALYVSTGAHSAVAPHADFITYTSHKTTRGIRSAIVSYKKQYHSAILNSLCAISQGAPKFSDILCNTVMFQELSKTNLNDYQGKVFLCSEMFIEAAKSYKMNTIGDGKSHLILVDLSHSTINASIAAGNLEKNNILITNHNGMLRFGTLTLATLGMGSNDLRMLYDIIFKIITAPGGVCKHLENDVARIMRQYTIKFYEENYGL